MTTKVVSKSSYVYGHISVIMVHTLIAILIILFSHSGKSSLYKEGNIAVACILLLMSLLSLVPVLSKHRRLVIE